MSNKTDLSDMPFLWKRYKETGDIELRNQLVKKYFCLVKDNATKMKRKLPRHIEVDDLICAGVFGLIDAVEAFDLSRNVKFQTYCIPRIRGAMLDELRTIDWVPRIIRSRNTQYQQVTKAQSNGNGHLLTTNKIAEYFNICIEEAERIKADGGTRIVRVYQVAQTARDEDYENNQGGYISSNSFCDQKTQKPEEELEKEDSFKELILCLTDKEQIIVTLYYRDNFQMWKIGEVLGLNESRISQMHDEALQKIKDSFLL